MYGVFTFVACFTNLFVQSVLPYNNTFFSLVLHGVCYLCVSFFVLFIFGMFFKEQKIILNRIKNLFL